MTDAYSSQPQPPFPGLLSPDQGDAKSQAIMALGAGLIKAGGPSETKNNFGGVGDAVLGGLDAYRKATTQALQNQYLKGQINQQTFGQLMTTMQTIGQLHWAGMPIPPALQKMANDNGMALPPGAAPAPDTAGPAGLAPSPQQTSAAPGRVPGLLSLPDTPGAAPAPGGPPPGLLSPSGPVGSILPGGAQIMGDGTPASDGPPPGLLSQGGQSPAPMPFNARIPPAGGMSSGPASISGVLDNLPARDRQGMIFGGPASKVITDVVSKNAELSRNQKDARDPAVLDFELRAKNGQLTPDEAAASRQGITPQEYVASTEAAKTAGGAVGKRIGEVIENGGQAARQTLNTVHEMRDAVTQGGNKLFVGPGSETWLKIKQGAVNAGFISPEDAGLPETEVLSKLNAALATQAVKAFTPRGTQFEVKMQMANNPGLLTSIEGTKKLLSLIEQGTSQNIAVGRLAMNQSNWKNWSDVEDRFYADPKNQIVSPFTGKLMGTALGAGDALNAGPVAATPTHFMSNGKGGRVGLVNNQWVPVDQTGAVLPKVGQSQ